MQYSYYLLYSKTWILLVMHRTKFGLWRIGQQNKDAVRLHNRRNQNYFRISTVCFRLGNFCNRLFEIHSCLYWMGNEKWQSFEKRMLCSYCKIGLVHWYILPSRILHRGTAAYQSQKMSPAHNPGRPRHPSYHSYKWYAILLTCLVWTASCVDQRDRKTNLVCFSVWVNLWWTTSKENRCSCETRNSGQVSTTISLSYRSRNRRKLQMDPNGGLTLYISPGLMKR